MSELLLQTMVEKFESLELFIKSIDWTKPQPVNLAPLFGEIQILKSELSSLLAQRTSDAKKLEELSLNIEHLKLRIEAMPKRSNVEHRHHLHKGIWMAFAWFLISLFLAWAWANTYQYKNQFESNDIKYRSLKIGSNRATLKLCKYTDSLFQSDPVGFKRKVELEEQKLIQRGEYLSLAGEKKRELKVSKTKAGRR